MKKNIIKQLFLFLFVASGLISCNSDPEDYSLEVPNDHMKIYATADSITLERANADKEAVKFSWNDAVDRGTDTKLTYYFRFYMSENNNKTSELVKIDPETHSISWSNRQMNDLLGSWQVSPGDMVELEAEIIAKVTASRTYMKPEISKIRFKVRGYDGSDLMYIMVKSGGSTRILTMNLTSEEGVYRWAGKMDPCEYWFITNKDNGYPAYVKGSNINALIYSNKGEGDHFIIDQQSLYDITVDVNKLTISLKATPIFHQLYMIKSLSGVETTTPMTNIEDGSNVFHWSGNLEAGTEIRFAPDQTNTWPAFVPGTDGISLIEGQSGATMLKVTKTATYEIIANLADNKFICIDVYALPNGGMWGIGDALVNAGWDMSKAYNSCAFRQTDLKNHPEIWTLTTDFQTSGEGAFKILTKPNEWSNEFVSANPNILNPCNTWLDIVSRTGGVGDNKFKPQVTGTWTVKVDIHRMKITMEK